MGLHAYKTGLLLLGLGFCSQALAASSPNKTAEARAFDEDCDQVCAYSRANETISLEIAYIENKVKKMEPLNPSDPTQEDALRANMASFCPQEGDVAVCKESYLVHARQRLAELRRGILENSDKVAKLAGARTANYDKGLSVSKIGPAPTPRKSKLPEFSKLNEAYQKDSDRFRDLISSEYQAWVQGGQQTLRAEPRREDFIKYKRLTRSNGQVDLVIQYKGDREENGPEIDETKYQAAVTEWKKSNATLERFEKLHVTQAEIERKNLGRLKKDRQTDVEVYDESAGGKGKGGRGAGVKLQQTRDAYNQGQQYLQNAIDKKEDKEGRTTGVDKKTPDDSYITYDPDAVEKASEKIDPKK